MYRQKYKEHRDSAKQRGISFDLSYEQWLEIWGDKIQERGVGANQYGMLRRRDEGGYTAGNVYIGTPKQNQQERVVAVRVKKSQATPKPEIYRPKPPVNDSWLRRRNVFDEYIEDDLTD